MFNFWAKVVLENQLPTIDAVGSSCVCAVDRIRSGCQSAMRMFRSPIFCSLDIRHPQLFLKSVI